MPAQRRVAGQPLTRHAIAARAAYILRDNSSGSATKAGPDLYPHQWSWDAAFNAIGLARVDPARAALELDSLFRGQWATGMVPHIVFDPTTEDYFPGPDRWDCARLTAAAPAAPRTSGLCQPPVHAIAARAIVAAGQHDWLPGAYPKLLAWHRFLARDRRDPETGLLAIHHGWESGCDNSPRWDGPYSRVLVGPDLPAYTRRDTAHVGDASERPTDAEYDRYLWLVEEAKRVHYDPVEMRRTSSFRVGDVLFTAIFAAAADTLADLAVEVGVGDEGELREDAAAARAAVLAQLDPATGLAADVDLRTGERLRTETVAGFAPLIAGGLPPAVQARQVELLFGPRWAGHPSLRWPLPPSTSPESPDFRPRTYWRGPVWPVVNWLLWWALDRCGEQSAAARLRDAGLDQLADGSAEPRSFAEYYEPFTGEPLGSPHQSWTAAVALDWLC